METARSVWEVVAGLLPGQPMEEYSHRWVVTSSAGPEDEKAMREAAFEHAAALQEGNLNWVRVEYVLF